MKVVENIGNYCGVYKTATIDPSFDLVIRQKYMTIEIVLIDCNSAGGAHKYYLSINRDLICKMPQQKLRFGNIVMLSAAKHRVARIELRGARLSRRTDPSLCSG